MGEMMPTGRPDRAGALLNLHVLGAFAVLCNGKRVAVPPSRKTRALLAYLAIVDRPQPRERLCRMFWNVPDDPRGALRWSLSKIRQIVNIDGRDILVTDRNGVALQSQSIALDMRQIKEISQHQLPSIGIAELQDAASLLQACQK